MRQKCPKLQVLAAYAEHKLKPEEMPPLETHMAVCSVCRQTVILVVKNKDLIEELSSISREDL